MAITVNQRDQLKARGLAYHPDLVIVYFVLNDVEQDIYRKGPKIEFFTEYTNIYQSSDWLSELSYVWSWSRYRVLKHMHANRYIQESVDSFHPDDSGWRNCRSALHGISRVRTAIADCPPHTTSACAF